MLSVIPGQVDAHYDCEHSYDKVRKEVVFGGWVLVDFDLYSCLLGYLCEGRVRDADPRLSLSFEILLFLDFYLFVDLDALIDVVLELGCGRSLVVRALRELEFILELIVFQLVLDLFGGNGLL